jgi:hypothetical protein
VSGIPTAVLFCWAHALQCSHCPQITPHRCTPATTTDPSGWIHTRACSDGKLTDADLAAILHTRRTPLLTATGSIATVLPANVGSSSDDSDGGRCSCPLFKVACCVMHTCFSPNVHTCIRKARGCVRACVRVRPSVRVLGCMCMRARACVWGGIIT